MNHSESAPASSSINWISIGAISGFLAVGTGAFGAHGLEKIADPEQIAWWNTGAEYHLTHSLALLAVGFVARTAGAGGKAAPKGIALAGWGLLSGIALFSGTLYAMGLGGPRWLGAITPIGGTLMMVGWLALAAAARRR